MPFGKGYIRKAGAFNYEEDKMAIRVRTCKTYNREMMEKYPRSLMMPFLTPRGDCRKYGYVASTEHSHYWGKTKKSAIANAKKSHGW